MYCILDLIFVRSCLTSLTCDVTLGMFRDVTLGMFRSDMCCILDLIFVRSCLTCLTCDVTLGMFRETWDMTLRHVTRHTHET